VRWYFPDSEYDHGIVSWRLLYPPFYWAAFIWAFCYWALTNHTLVHGPVQDIYQYNVEMEYFDRFTNNV
jgi:hypothetical protein